MEVAYILAGKRFQAKNAQDMNIQLSKYNLTHNLTKEGLGFLGVRRVTDLAESVRYEMIQTSGDSTDNEGFDVCIGRLLGESRDSRTIELEMSELEMSELEIAMNEVKQDIPDSKIIGGSYLI